jgi:sodium/bile acid cotransporter 7
MKTYFLPVGLLISLIVSLVMPAPGVYLKELGLIPWCVVIIFFVNGYQTELKELPKSKSFVYTLLVTSFICLILSPLLGLVTAGALQLGLGLTLGLLVKSAVPSTLSTCIVMTNLAGGRGTWALMMTVIINIIGVFSIPFMLGITASGNIDFDIDPIMLLQKLVLLVLCPFIAGYLVKKLSLLSPQHPFLTYLPSTMVITAVWLSLSASAEILYTINAISLGKIALASIIVHFGLMLIAMIAAKFLPIDSGAQVAMALTASQKTLPVAVSILASFNQNVGDAVLFCVLFHFIQLFADAALLPKLKRFYKL